jgi:peptidoglycan/xylan/chitin deacetylase (PgdA/CDA1 family)
MLRRSRDRSATAIMGRINPCEPAVAPYRAVHTMGLLRRWGKAAARSVGPFVAGRFQPRRVILCYHSVHPSRPFRSATPEMFAAHLAWLAEHCDVVPLRTLVSQRTAPGGDRPQVAVTFDDGHVDNHQFALPLLIEHRIPATFYVTTGYLGRDPAVLARFAMLRRTTISDIEPLSWGQLRELAAAGMEIGAHTFSHPNLVHLGAEDLAREIEEPKSEIETRLGREVETFAYPFGELHRHVNGAAVAAVQAAGFRSAVTAAGRGVRASDSLFTLPRFFATTSIEGLASILRGDGDLVGFLQERMPHPRPDPRGR